MTDYKPLDIGGVCNAGPSLLGDEHVETGPQSFLGLPFLIGGGDAGENCFVAVSGSSGAVTVPIGAAARGLVFVHRLLKSEVARGGPLGVDVSDYVFRYDDGSEERVRVRERFEIGSIPGKDDIPGVPGPRSSRFRTWVPSCMPGTTAPGRRLAAARPRRPTYPRSSTTSGLGTTHTPTGPLRRSSWCPRALRSWWPRSRCGTPTSAPSRGRPAAQ